MNEMTSNMKNELNEFLSDFKHFLEFFTLEWLTDQPTDRGSYRAAVAHLNMRVFHYLRERDQKADGQIDIPTDRQTDQRTDKAS